MCHGCRKVVKTGWQVVRPMDALPANRTWPPSCCHGTYQHKAITSRSRQLLMMGTWLPETCWATISREIKYAANPSMDALPANRTWPPSCSHGTYQHEAITSRSRQLLMMGTWLPETFWATSRREIKNTKVTSSWFILSTLKGLFVNCSSSNKRNTSDPAMVFHLKCYLCLGPAFLSFCYHINRTHTQNHATYRYKGKVKMYLCTPLRHTDV
jgi:hypothetical protein